ncbi:2-hydroxy-6-oxononadienedioate/2-hydroxy-6-oxononatrienedioate hydrolase [Pseudovibrio axinellae]|uniref:2-hydroxy-6-oxononadienedioate/2-hydroxy-6-oxononatrienedioate hydrolase n=1 Tax=Pseudovibrio axinellae TaxID=989403 RepID=A0A165WIG4_9HYPH|nr:alpha/beta hydrolase [Pseudovibrio axinellae]KZL16561.1 2-hydroxy-6-oxononadienedioate/2-hydroxy-6-oxononatrienedioate hydrolase [Pseudovibrio axinellae]SEQ15724.1 Pimeloyl-ACP methyl ester carboxylesterase [Pseudovibrio axinellae]
MTVTAPANTIVFIPGLACTGAVFSHQIASLKEHAIMIAETFGQDTIEAMARRLLDHAPEKFALAGYSMGGYIALETIRIAPERVDRLALISTNARIDLPAQTQLRQAQMEIVKKGGYHKIAAIQYTQLVHPARHTDITLRQTIVDMAEEVGAENYLKQQHAIINRRDQRPNLSSIQCPTIILAGADDKLLPLDRSYEMHESITQSELHILPHCGHIAPLEHPAHTNELIQDWINR